MHFIVSCTICIKNILHKVRKTRFSSLQHLMCRFHFMEGLWFQFSGFRCDWNRHEKLFLCFDTNNPFVLICMRVFIILLFTQAFTHILTQCESAVRSHLLFWWRTLHHADWREPWEKDHSRFETGKLLFTASPNMHWYL